jgi:hypothetical protein
LSAKRRFAFASLIRHQTLAKPVEANSSIIKRVAEPALQATDANNWCLNATGQCIHSCQFVQIRG